MGLEAPGLIKDFDASWPLDTDDCLQGDDHIKLVKGNLQTQFPNLEAAVTPTAFELNQSGGVSSNIQAQIDALSATVAAFVAVLPGTILAYGSLTAPAGYVFCNGALLNGSAGQAGENLWPVIGTSFGGTGQTSFAVPNLLNRTPVCAGSSFAIGQALGVENASVGIGQGNLPAISIRNPNASRLVISADSITTSVADDINTTLGSGTPLSFNLRSPQLGVGYIIKL